MKFKENELLKKEYVKYINEIVKDYNLSKFNDPQFREELIKFYTFLCNKHNFDANNLKVLLDEYQYNFIDIIYDNIKSEIFAIVAKQPFWNDIKSKIYFGIKPTNDFIGSVVKRDSGFLILFSSGLLDSYTRLVRLIADAVQVEKESEEDFKIKIQNIVVEILRYIQDQNILENEFALKNEIEYLHNTASTDDVNLQISNVCFKFILLHELSHIILNHFNYKSKTHNIVFFQELSSIFSKRNIPISHRKEFEADILSVTMLLSEYKNLSGFNPYDYSQSNKERPDITIYSVYLYFQILIIVDSTFQDILGVETNSNTHPSIQKRINLIVAIVKMIEPKLLVFTHYANERLIIIRDAIIKIIKESQ